MIKEFCQGARAPPLCDEYMFIVCSMLEAPECLGNRIKGVLTEYRVHPEGKIQKKGALSV